MVKYAKTAPMVHMVDLRASSLLRQSHYAKWIHISKPQYKHGHFRSKPDYCQENSKCDCDKNEDKSQLDDEAGTLYTIEWPKTCENWEY